MRNTFLILSAITALLTQFVLANSSAIAQEASSAETTSLVDSFLQSGQLAAGEDAIRQRIDEQPDNQTARFELGTLKFMQAIEHLGQAMYRYGSSERMRAIPFLRLPVLPNDDPQPISYENLREVLATLERDLAASDEVLATIDDRDVKLPLHLFQFHLDFDSSGAVDENESMQAIYAMYFDRPRTADPNEEAQEVKEIVVVFDYADVHWLRGYCALLRGMCQFILAHDQSEFWHVIAHRFFPKAEVKFDFISEEPHDEEGWLEFGHLADIVAGIHNLRWPVTDPDKLAQSRQLLLEMIQQSRLMWDAVEAETDDDREWIPGPDQQSAVTAFQITQDMIKTWREFLDEGEKVLNGELLIPFWRGHNVKRGVNLARVFKEQREFDLVLWIQGSAAVDFLEEGAVSKPETWERFQRAFRGDFVGFAVWVN